MERRNRILKCQHTKLFPAIVLSLATCVSALAQRADDGLDAQPPLSSATPTVPSSETGDRSSNPSGAPIRDDSAATAAVINDMEALDNSYVLEIGDMITFRVVEDRQPVRRIRVQDSGDVQVPYINAVKAAGLTPRQLAEQVKAALEKNLFKQATVIVTLDMRAARDPNFQRPEEQVELEEFFIYGKGVTRKGRFNLPPEGELMVSEAVMSAGPTQFANLSKVKLERGGKTYRINLKKVLNKGELDADAKLLPGDKILVGERIFNF